MIVERPSGSRSRPASWRRASSRCSTASCRMAHEASTAGSSCSSRSRPPPAAGPSTTSIAIFSTAARKARSHSIAWRARSRSPRSNWSCASWRGCRRNTRGSPPSSNRCTRAASHVPPRDWPRSSSARPRTTASTSVRCSNRVGRFPPACCASRATFPSSSAPWKRLPGCGPRSRRSTRGRPACRAWPRRSCPPASTSGSTHRSPRAPRPRSPAASRARCSSSERRRRPPSTARWRSSPMRGSSPRASRCQRNRTQGLSS